MIKIKSEAIAIGIAPGRPSSLPKIGKPVRIGLVAIVCVVGVWLYWMHLEGLTHVHATAAASAAVATTTASKPVAAAIVTTAAKDAAATTKASDSIKLSAREQVAALWTYLLETVKAAPAPAAKPETVAAPQPATPAVAAAVSTTPKMAPKPVTDQDRLMQAAQMALQDVLDQASAYPDSYGFKADDVLQKAKLGKAMPVYSVTEQDCDNYRTGQPVKSLLKPADRWVFPVSIGDRICCMVQVNRVGHNFVPAGGNKMLGLAWNQITQKWPESQGYHPLVVVNANVPGYYFTVPELPAQNLTDIVRMFEYDTSLSPAEVILASWR